MAGVKIKKGDRVRVLTGKDRGKRGRALRIMPARSRAIVERINMLKRHTRPNPVKGQPGGILEKEMPIHVSNVALINPATQKADRIGFKTLDDGRKVRVFKSNGETVEA